MNCKMISLDSSSTDTGYAIWEDGMLTSYGHINLDNVLNVKNRTDVMMQEIYALISRERPNIIVVEGLTVFNNIKTDSNLSDIIGAIRGYSLLCTDCWFDRLFPSEWRKLIADEEIVPRKRLECKAWDIKMLMRHFNISTVNDNIADAILIGLAYCRLFGENYETYLELAAEEDIA